MKFKTEVKYYGKPIKFNKDTEIVIDYGDNYTKEEYEIEYLEDAIRAMHKELVIINKKKSI